MHERIRQHSQAAAKQMKGQGSANDLIARLEADDAFAKVDFSLVVDPRKFIGRAPQQVDEFLADVVEPIRQRYRGHLAQQADVTV